MRKKISDAEENLFAQIRIRRLPVPRREYFFDERRKWRFDFAWPAHKLAVEVEGGNYSGGRHTRGKGFEDDCEKYNAAVLLGWRVLRYTPKSMTWKNWTAAEQIEQALAGPERRIEQLELRAEGMGA